MRDSPSARSPSWKWWICGLLLLASTINYMDRQTLASASVRINKQFELSKEQYGKLESYFGYAFAAGSTLFGIAADRWSVRWLYPFVRQTNSSSYVFTRPVANPTADHRASTKG